MKRLGKWSPLSASFIALCSAATAWSESTIAPDNQSKEGKTAVPNALRAVQTNKVIPDIFIAPSTDSSTQSAPPLTSVISKLKLVIEQDDVILSGMHGIEIRVLNNGDRPI